jgi:hypothetical protein
MIIDHGIGDVYQHDNGYLTGLTGFIFSVAGISEVSDVDIWKGQPRAGGTWQGKPNAGGDWKDQQDN